MNELVSLNATELTVDGIETLRDLLVVSNPTLVNLNVPALLGVSNVQITSNPLLGSVSFPVLKAYTGSTGFQAQLSIKSNPVLTSINLNSLIFSSGSIGISSNTALAALQLDALVFCYLGFSAFSNPSLVSLNLPSLVGASVYSPFFGFEAHESPLLANVSFPKYLPTKGRKQNFKNCALTESSVEHILSRCVASAGYSSGTVDLSGGTNAIPGTQGQIDKSVLIARGCTVTTN